MFLRNNYYILSLSSKTSKALTHLFDDAVSFCAECGKQLCDALCYLHSCEKPIIYGNMNTSNIILKPDGTLKILGLDILHEDSGMIFNESLDKKINGYEAPEQLCVDTSIDIRTDIYRLGVTLYHLVTGQNPCEWVDKIYPIRHWNQSLSKGLEDVIQKCFQQDKSDRYQSCSDVLYCLENSETMDCCYKKHNKLKEFWPLYVAPKKHKTDKFDDTIYLDNHRNIQTNQPQKYVQISDDEIKNEKSTLKLDKVEFSALAPKTLSKNEYSLINIIMYEYEFRNVVNEFVANSDGEVNETRSGIISVEKNATVKINLFSPEIEIEDNEESYQWCGEYLKFQFAVKLPNDYRKNQILFTATVYINGVIATRLKFIAKCKSQREQKMKVLRYDVLTAFISYASQDRNRVALIIQGMRKSRPDMEIFFDVDALRSGDEWEKTLMQEIDNRDVLLLCWSKFAKDSEWVEIEWKYALDNKGIEFIEPIPLDPPTVCPPPKELGSKHFNDRELYYRFIE